MKKYVFFYCRITVQRAWIKKRKQKEKGRFILLYMGYYYSDRMRKGSQ